MPDFVQDYSDRIQSRILDGSTVRREFFNPCNKQHRSSLQKFIKTGNWGDVHFFAEFPYITVPETVLRKFALHHLKNS